VRCKVDVVDDWDVDYPTGGNPAPLTVSISYSDISRVHQKMVDHVED
jgi:hypothetical protein